MVYLILLFEFFKIGLFAIGGGLATVPFLTELANKYDWFTREELTNMIGISESTPGPIGINMATYAGFMAGSAEHGSAGGVIGGVTATVALVLPSFIIMLFLVRALSAFKDNKHVRSAFYGLRPAAAALVASAAIAIASVTFINAGEFTRYFEYVDIKTFALFVVCLVLSISLKKIQPLHLIAAAAVTGIVFSM